MAGDGRHELTTAGRGPGCRARPPRASLRSGSTGITKRYGAVTACDHVDLDLQRGRVHGVLGENGAGKSTLMKIMIGLVTPTQGRSPSTANRVRLLDPIAAARHGIGMVHQHFSLVEPLRVWENVALGDDGHLRPGGGP